MNNVRLKYKRGPFWRIIDVLYPGSWDELTREQFVDIISVIQKDYITESDNIFIINSILGMKKLPLFNFPDRLNDLNRFIFEIKEPFSKVFIRDIFATRIKLYGPQDEFNNVKIGEFSFSDTYFLRYIKHHQPADLNRMIAVLYRPEGKFFQEDSPEYTGDIREKFNENIIEYRARLVDYIPRREKQAILFNYRIIRKWIESKYPHVFPQNGDEQAMTIKLGKSDEPGWDKFLRSLCNGDITKLDLVADQYLHNVLAEANDAILESKKET